jgi:hypothetical protein
MHDLLAELEVFEEIAGAFFGHWGRLRVVHGAVACFPVLGRTIESRANSVIPRVRAKMQTPKTVTAPAFAEAVT